MKLILFIPEIINDDWKNIQIELLIVGGAWLMVLIAMAIDLYFGIQKSKKIGDFITSEGYRRSIQKFVYYYSTLLFALIFDCILSPITYYLQFPLNITPIITMFACLALVFTEYKSVREKAHEKLRRRTDSSFLELAKILKDKDLLSRIYHELAKKEDNEPNDQ